MIDVIAVVMGRAVDMLSAEDNCIKVTGLPVQNKTKLLEVEKVLHQQHHILKLLSVLLL